MLTAGHTHDDLTSCRFRNARKPLGQIPPQPAKTTTPGSRTRGSDEPVKKLLVPFDGSQHSNEALARAADLARRYEASLLILYVDHPLTYALPKGCSRVTPEQLAETRERFEPEVAQAEHAAVREDPLQVETLLQRSDP